MTKSEVHRIAEANYRRHCKRVEEALRAILPLAESYLKGAPSHPDNALIEDAKALVITYGPSAGESPFGLKETSSGSLGRAHQFTPTERKALRAAAQESLAGMFQGNIKALESALEKL